MHEQRGVNHNSEHGFEEVRVCACVCGGVQFFFFLLPLIDPSRRVNALSNDRVEETLETREAKLGC